MTRLKALCMTALFAAVSTMAVTAQGIAVTKDSPTVTEDFNSMWNGSEAVKTLPTGWRIDRNTSAPRSVNSWTSASEDVMYTGGVNLASNASNGTWNFGSSADASDRAIGGLSTTVSNGTRCVSLMTCITNDDADLIKKLSVSYDIEKYRDGSNAAGFAVQVYTSNDGVNWTSAGDDFYTFFAPDAATAGAAVVPISTTNVADKNLLADLAPGKNLYIAWNITVASGTSPNAAPGLAIDNVAITASFAEAGAESCNLYIEDLTGWENLMVCASDNSLGTFPGMASTGSKTVNGVNYKAFELPSAPLTLSANNGVYYSLPAITIAESGDYYFTATTEGLMPIADAYEYSGYVDPSIPTFKASGIYLRGEVNSWGAAADWQFSDEGNGSYALYNKTLSGQFKVADAGWSSSCNYGTNGGNAYPGIPYSLVAGTDSNCSTGTNTYICKEIRLNITSDGAILNIITDDNGVGLTKLYAVGDFNNWNYMDTEGQLDYDTTDGLFRGTITMPKGSDGLSHWRIYQKLGMGGAWGLAENAAESAVSGTLVKGQTGNAAVAPGTYTIAFDLATGEYTLDRQAATIVDMKLNPSAPLLVTNVPSSVKVLSLNNSLIDYSDQPDIFNYIAEKMGVDAKWTRHTNLGKSLDYHWDEGDGLTSAGTPGAKLMIRSEAWTHIILQEQTNRPLTNTEGFRASVKKWVDYIRENCPNPNAIIILPVNWGYSSDLDNFVSNNAKFLEIYQSVAAEEGVILCPVSSAYSVAYNELGGMEMKDYMFLDDRHPVDRSAFMAAMMEYSIIYGVDPEEITVLPELQKTSPSAGTIKITEAEAADMRHYASVALSNFSNYINHVEGTVSFHPVLIDDSYLEYDPSTPVSYSVNGGGSIDENGVFTSDGTPGEYTVTATCEGFTRTTKVKVAEAIDEVVKYPAIELNEKNLSATENFDSMGDGLELPEAWRIDRNLSAPRQVQVYGAADNSVMYAGGVNLPSNAKNGTWNFGSSADSSDRAVGGITTSVSGGTRGVNVYTHLLNTGKKNLTNAILTYDIEKYRDGNNAEGFTVQLYYSLDGKNWTSAGDNFKTDFAPSASTVGSATVPMESVTVSDLLPVDLQPSVDLYLAWNISVTSGTACAGAPALGIDNVSIECSLPAIPTAQHYIYAEDLTGWATLGLYAWGDSELFGAWPGEAFVDEKEIEGTVYKVFLLDVHNNGSYNLIFNNWNNGSQAPDFAITPDRDLYLVVTPEKVTEKKNYSAVESVQTASGIVRSGNVVKAEGANSISVYNAAGMLVRQTAADKVDLAPLASGLYIVSAKTADGQLVSKVIR